VEVAYRTILSIIHAENRRFKVIPVGKIAKKTV